MLIAFLPAVEPGESFAWSPGAPPSPAAATRAFGQLLRARYPSEYGYWICPAAQVEGNDVYCAGEVHAGSRYHSLDAAASSSHGRIVFARVTGHTWVRRWHRLDQTTLGGNGAPRNPAAPVSALPTSHQTWSPSQPDLSGTVGSSGVVAVDGSGILDVDGSAVESSVPAARRSMVRSFLGC